MTAFVDKDRTDARFELAEQSDAVLADLQWVGAQIGQANVSIEPVRSVAMPIKGVLGCDLPTLRCRQ